MFCADKNSQSAGLAARDADNNNNKVCASGDIVLMDFGAEYSNYCSDLTRCFPVSGRFSNRQRQVYNSVLKVMKSAKKMLIARDKGISEQHKINILSVKSVFSLK